MGAMTGGAVGGVAHLLLPDYTGSVGAYALVGMGAAFAGIIRVPLTSVIMVFEITRDYSIIVPLMIANLISYYISSRLQEEPIYEALLHQDGIASALRREGPRSAADGGECHAPGLGGIGRQPDRRPGGRRDGQHGRLAGGGCQRPARHGDRAGVGNVDGNGRRLGVAGRSGSRSRPHGGDHRSAVPACPRRPPAGRRYAPYGRERPRGSACGEPHERPRVDGRGFAEGHFGSLRHRHNSARPRGHPSGHQGAPRRAPRPRRPPARPFPRPDCWRGWWG